MASSQTVFDYMRREMELMDRQMSAMMQSAFSWPFFDDTSSNDARSGMRQRDRFGLLMGDWDRDMEATMDDIRSRLERMPRRMRTPALKGDESHRHSDRRPSSTDIQRSERSASKDSHQKALVPRKSALHSRVSSKTDDTGRQSLQQPSAMFMSSVYVSNGKKGIYEKRGGYMDSTGVVQGGLERGYTSRDARLAGTAGGKGKYSDRLVKAKRMTYAGLYDEHGNAKETRTNTQYHNVEEDEVDSFERDWKTRARHVLSGSDAGYLDRSIDSKALPQDGRGLQLKGKSAVDPTLRSSDAYKPRLRSRPDSLNSHL